jgi:predicted AAA+ superfamily ATPase
MLREFGNLQKIKDHFPKWVISLDEMETNSFEGIKHVHLKKFLITGLNL